MKFRQSLFISLIAGCAVTANAELVAHYDMTSKSGYITESISGDKFAIEGNFSPENVPGAVGEALRFDGYTSHVVARLGDILPADSKTMTASIWVAVPCYPIIQIDVDTTEQTPIVNCLDTKEKK